MATIRKRDFNIVKGIKREIDLRTKTESTQKPKYNRKTKYKGVYND